MLQISVYNLSMRKILSIYRHNFDIHIYLYTYYIITFLLAPTAPPPPKRQNGINRKIKYRNRIDERLEQILRVNIATDKCE